MNEFAFRADREGRISIATIMLATVFQVLVMGSLIAGIAG